MKKYNK